MGLTVIMESEIGDLGCGAVGLWGCGAVGLWGCYILRTVQYSFRSLLIVAHFMQQRGG